MCSNFTKLLFILCINNVISKFLINIPNVISNGNNIEIHQQNEHKTYSDWTQTVVNSRPIIGILAEDLSYSLLPYTNKSSQIVSSYVKFVESAGARVVPILIDQSPQYYENMSQYVNGFLFPGGGLPVDTTSGYGRTGKTILELVIKAAENNKPIPLWGTCLGFEMLFYLLSPTDPRQHCKASNIALPIKFTGTSRLFSEAPEHLVQDLQNKNITSNFHSICISVKEFGKLGLNEHLKIISTSTDKNGLEFVSTFEHKKYPIYGTQWHPEKAIFEWNEIPGHSNIPHQFEAIQAAQYTANFFVQEARKNLNRFPSIKDELEASIHNYEEIYTAGMNVPFSQIYFL